MRNKEFIHFVRWATAKQVLVRWSLIKPINILLDGKQAKLSILFQDYPFQVELVEVFPAVTIPLHRHHYCESWEYSLRGSGIATIGDYTIEVDADMPRKFRFVPKLVWHGGVSGKDGATWLSIQNWSRKPMISIARDWEEKYEDSPLC